MKRIKRRWFSSFLLEQAGEAENANAHDLSAAFCDWAAAIDNGEIQPPAPGTYGFIGGTNSDDIAFFLIEVTA